MIPGSIVLSNFDATFLNSGRFFYAIFNEWFFIKFSFLLFRKFDRSYSVPLDFFLQFSVENNFFPFIFSAAQTLLQFSYYQQYYLFRSLLNVLLSFLLSFFFVLSLRPEPSFFLFLFNDSQHVTKVTQSFQN